MRVFMYCQNTHLLESLCLYVSEDVDINKENWRFWEVILDDSKTG